MRILTSYIGPTCSRVISEEVQCIGIFHRCPPPQPQPPYPHIFEKKKMYVFFKKASLHLFNNIFLGQ